MVSQWLIPAATAVSTPVQENDHSCIYFSLEKFKSPLAPLETPFALGRRSSMMKMEEISTSSTSTSTSNSTNTSIIQIDLHGLDMIHTDISIEDVVDFNEEDLFRVQDFDAFLMHPIEEKELEKNENSLIDLNEIGATDQVLDALLAESDTSSSFEDSFDDGIQFSPIKKEETSTKVEKSSQRQHCAYITCNQPCTDFEDESSNPLCDYHLQYLIGCRLNFQLKASLFKQKQRLQKFSEKKDKPLKYQNAKENSSSSSSSTKTKLKAIPFPMELTSRRNPKQVE
jgi:hypothetical protein